MNVRTPHHQPTGEPLLPGAPPLRLSVVIPAWNAGPILAGHLPRMVDEARSVSGGADIVIVDDGSGPEDTLADVAAGGGPLVRLVRRARNEGFAAACNAGAAAARGACVLFLNTDMHVEPGCFEVLLAVLESHPDVFGVTPVIVNLEGGFPESSSRIRFRRGVFDLLLPGRTGEQPPAVGESRPIAYGCGGALLCRRSELLSLGGFSRLYAPIYWDDADLGWRAWRYGLATLEVGGPRILHDHARTMSSHARAGRIRALSERNRVLFTWVHLTGLAGWSIHAAWFLPRVLAAALRRDRTALGMLAAFSHLGGVVRERRGIARSGRLRGIPLSTIRAAGSTGWPAGGPTFSGSAVPGSAS